MKFNFLRPLPLRLVLSVLVGVLLAAMLVDVKTSCTNATPGESISNCVEFAKAVTRPDVFKNDPSAKQSFALVFVAGSFVTFGGVTLLVRRK